MFAYELARLKILNIQAIKWGSSYRVKVRGRTGKMVYVSNISRTINKRLVAKQYNISIETLETHTTLRLDFYDKLENVLSTQVSAFKVNVALGYELVSKTDPDDTRYFYPNLANTHVFNSPIAINSKADIRKKVISEIRSMEMADKLNYPSSGNKLKAITAFKIFIYHRDHALGDSEAVIPKTIRENKHVINFPKTNNKCQKYLCGLCYCQLTADTTSADRINNNLGHIDGNILVSCVKCNTARKDMSLRGFRYKKLLELNSDRLVYSIDKEEKDIYSKMKANIAGGPIEGCRVFGTAYQ
ncbi:unnamed protein product [Phytophthora lilii]|uniref:Unnamed protein product n=1 Tax=Phytophthora lilii TaxID=2077276 RepID=A0A9W6YLG2_9STRA|nr:unnamed protein product [Phytophthora lilii]